MKRSYSEVDERGSGAVARRRLEKVQNSLCDVAFPWPEVLCSEQDQTQILSDEITLFDEEFTRFTDDSDVFSSDDGGSLKFGNDDDDDLLLDLLTEEDWLLDDNASEVLQPSQHLANGSSRSGDADITSMMDKECLDYFMAEYQKAKSNSTNFRYTSFSEFVSVSLEMISSFSKTLTNNQYQVRNTSKIQPTATSGCSFDYSIQNWRRRVMTSSTGLENMGRTTCYSCQNQSGAMLPTYQQIPEKMSQGWLGPIDCHHTFDVNNLVDPSYSAYYHSYY